VNYGPFGLLKSTGSTIAFVIPRFSESTAPIRSFAKPAHLRGRPLFLTIGCGGGERGFGLRLWQYIESAPPQTSDRPVPRALGMQPVGAAVAPLAILALIARNAQGDREHAMSPGSNSLANRQSTPPSGARR
jgi:hypothetical protein